MVARIRSGKSIRGAVNYNESKVKLGKAKLLMAKGYPKDPQLLGFSEKVNRLQKLADLNTRVTTNCLHLSLNFDPTEQLSTDKLKQIAEQYMQGIGFEKQPYLVYLHNDVAHQHIHIVSTNIQKDGSRISLHRLGADASEKTRKELEITFGLKKASTAVNLDGLQVGAIHLSKLQYGQVSTKRAISNIVTEVVNSYKFASIAELNALLGLYNVYADRGEPTSIMYKRNGLRYTAIDSEGKKMGVPIKASSIYGSPTLKDLEACFSKNRVAKLAHRTTLQEKIAGAIASSKNKSHLTSLLAEQQIAVIYRQNDEGYIYGITYVDNKTKTVFNGSQLGKAYSMTSILQVWDKQTSLSLTSAQPASKDPDHGSKPGRSIADGSSTRSQNLQKQNFNKSDIQITHQPSLVDLLTDPFIPFDSIPYELRQKRRRKKNKRTKKENKDYEYWVE